MLNKKANLLQTSNKFSAKDKREKLNEKRRTNGEEIEGGCRFKLPL